MFANQSRRRVDELFAALWVNDDQQGYDLAQGVLAGEHTWLENGVVDPSGEGPIVAPAR